MIQEMNKMLVTILTVAVLSGCGQSDSCPDDLDRYNSDFIVTGVKEVVAVHQSGEVLSDETMAIDIDQLLLRVELDYIDTYTANATTVWQSVGHTLANLLIKPSYACSPVGHRLTTPVVGMGLISNASLGDSYSPGVSLGSIFEAEASTAEEFRFSGSRRVDAIELISIDNPIADSVRYDLRLNLPSAQLLSTAGSNELHRFTLALNLSDGQSFSVDTAPILITINGS